MAEPAAAAPASRANPLKLNPLQLKTLAILQALARTPNAAEPPDPEGRVALRYLPDPHGDHFHVGSAVVATRDAAGLGNPAVYGALARKGLVLQAPNGAPMLTADGLAYETGVAHQILHGADH
jgi:hypothetical protein